jgi:uncharacterized protein YneF (UPF0154 family)
MKNWKAILGVTLVFVLGIAAGSLGTLRFIRHNLQENPGPFMREQVFRRMVWELDLNPAQRRQMRQIMADTQVQLRDVRQQVDPQMREILRGMDDKVRAILLETQRERYNELVRNRRQFLEKLDHDTGGDWPRRPLLQDGAQTNRTERLPRRPRPETSVPAE